MSQRFLRGQNVDNLGYPIIGKNSEVFAEADPVTIDSNGFLDGLTTPGTTTRVIGFHLGAATMAATNQTVAKVKPQYIKADKCEMAFPSDIDCTQTDVGVAAHFTTGSATGAFVVDLLAGGDGPVFVLGFDPDGLADNDDVVCVAAEPQHLFSQA